MKKNIYFDYAAATPVHPKVLKAMLPYFQEDFANPSAVYQCAQHAKGAIERSRENVASALGCTPREVIFTSGGTESNNLFILGAAEALSGVGKHIITTKIEHDSVLKPLEYLESKGFSVTYLYVEKNGIVEPSSVEAALRPDTIFVTVMYANNEIGTIQPIAEIGQVIRDYKNTRHSPFFHTDACQAVQFLDLDVGHLGVDSMTLNSGKIYGPKGAGALYIKNGCKIAPQIRGGSQEYGVRAGTENVPAIVGFAAALEIAMAGKKKETARLERLRDTLIKGILETIPRARLNGDKKHRLPNNVNISFYGVLSEAILHALSTIGIAESAGSACSAGALKTSHVISALGLPEIWARGATRLSLGKGNTTADVKFLLRKLPEIIADLRKDSPFV